MSTTDPFSRFAPTYADCYAFSGNAGEQIVISMKSSAVDSYLNLMDSTGLILAFNDDAAPGNNDSQITYSLPASGTYLIEATSRVNGSTGAYSISLTKAGP